MNRNRMIVMAAAVAAGMSAGAPAISAPKNEFVVYPRVTTTQWRTHLPNAPIRGLHVWARKAGGGSETFFNMRFGRDGHSFDGRRVYLSHSGLVRASWDLNGRTPEGKELILNSYNGSVYVEKIVVEFAKGGRSHPQAPPSRGGYHDPGYGDYRYDDDYRRDPYPQDPRYHQEPRYRQEPQYQQDPRYRQDPRYHPDPRYGRSQPDYGRRPEPYPACPPGCQCGYHGQAHAYGRVAPSPRGHAYPQYW